MGLIKDFIGLGFYAVATVFLISELIKKLKNRR